MDAIVFGHVPVADLPAAWREKLAQPAGARVTVRIEAEEQTAETQGAAAFADDPLFGMWRRPRGHGRRAGLCPAPSCITFQPRRLAQRALRSTPLVLIDSDVLVWLTRGHLGAAQGRRKSTPGAFRW